MSYILQGALDPRVAPSGILRRHPDHQAADLGEDLVGPECLFAYVHFRTMSSRCHRKIVSGVTMVAI